MRLRSAGQLQGNEFDGADAGSGSRAVNQQAVDDRLAPVWNGLASTQAISQAPPVAIATILRP